MNTDLTIPDWEARRSKQRQFAAGMLLFLVASALFFWYARTSLDASVANGFAESRALSAARQQEADALATRQFHQGAKAFSEAAARRGLLPANWAERRFNVRNAALSRYEANELFSSIARTDSRFFNVEEFEVAVSGDSEGGLFSAKNQGQSNVSVTVQGTLVFRASEGSR